MGGAGGHRTIDTRSGLPLAEVNGAEGLGRVTFPWGSTGDVGKCFVE